MAPLITMTGLGSGMDYGSWIDALVEVEQSKIDKISSQVKSYERKQTAITEMKGYYQALQDVIDSFSSVIASDNIFAQKAATSSSDSISVKSTTNANPQDLSVSVSQLATSTVAKSSFVAAKSIDADTSIGDIAGGIVKEGTFSVYVNGEKNEIAISKENTVQDFLDKVNSIEGISASVADGKLNISSSDSSTYDIIVGSSSDTSNFQNLMSLTRDTDTGNYSSSKAIFETDITDSLVSAKFSEGTVTAGTFTIGDTEFTIDENTKLSELIKDINNSSAGATAYWDSNAGKLVLTATTEGATSINIEAGTSNFTDIMGFTTSTWDEDGNVTSSKLNANSQTLGTNAVLSINGTTVTSTSNTVGSDVTGLSGLTLTLNKVTTENAKISVSNDSSGVMSAIKNFVSTFNNIMTTTETATNRDTGTLKGESVLNTLKNNIRRTATQSTGDGAYDSLAKIGITTGKFTGDTTSATNQLVIDEEKLMNALKDDPDAIKNLFTGVNGIFTKMQSSVTNALKTGSGYFDSRNSTYKSQITGLNSQISKKELSLEAYKKTLETKFQAMDEMISKLQNQASVFESYFNNDNNKSSSKK